jgi:hypothetical protein
MEDTFTLLASISTAANINVIYQLFNIAEVIGMSAFLELLDISSQACAWRDAYALCP